MIICHFFLLPYYSKQSEINNFWSYAVLIIFCSFYKIDQNMTFYYKMGTKVEVMVDVGERRENNSALGMSHASISYHDNVSANSMTQSA